MADQSSISKQLFPHATGLTYLEQIDDACGIGGFIDVETTGLNPHRDEIIELALILFAFHRETHLIAGIVDEYSGLREPSVSISPGAARVNGITMDEVRGRQLDDERVNGMISRAEFLIAHNASFDRSFVSGIYRIAAMKPWFCSMNGINWYRTGCSSRSLQNLLMNHGIRPIKAHRADGDVLAALQLLARLNSEGRYYLDELLGAGSKVV
jgi:DNA polymerase III subunit epsilon